MYYRNMAGHRVPQGTGDCGEMKEGSNWDTRCPSEGFVLRLVPACPSGSLPHPGDGQTRDGAGKSCLHIKKTVVFTVKYRQLWLPEFNRNKCNFV